jgi:CheY-like chemotaxis protein
MTVGGSPFSLARFLRADPGAPGPEAPPPRVLFIDDEPFIREVALRALRGAGLAALAAADGAEGLDLYRAHHDDIRLVVLDLLMPGLDGWQTLAGMRRVRPEVAVVLTTGQPSDAFQEHPEAAHVRGFLCKPYSLATLVELVTRIVLRGETASPLLPNH